MNDEKISLRIEAEELERIDAYLAAHPEEGSRSHFIKNCVRERLMRDASGSADTVADKDTIMVRLPERLMVAVEAAVDEGWYNDAGDFIVTILRDRLKDLRAAADTAASAAAERATPGSR